MQNDTPKANPPSLFIYITAPVLGHRHALLGLRPHPQAELHGVLDRGQAGRHVGRVVERDAEEGAVAVDGVRARGQVLALPDGPQAVDLRVQQVEDGVVGRAERVRRLQPHVRVRVEVPQALDVAAQPADAVRRHDRRRVRPREHPAARAVEQVPRQAPRVGLVPVLVGRVDHRLGHRPQADRVVREGPRGHAAPARAWQPW